MTQPRQLLGPDAMPVPAGLPAAIRDAASGAGRMRGALDGDTGLPLGRTLAGSGFGYAYDADSWSSPELGDWSPWIRSPDQEINFNRDRRVARTRDLYRNDGWARGAIGRILDSTIGATYRLIAQPDYRLLRLYGGPAFDTVWAREFRQVAEALWREYAEDLGRYCDKERRLTVAQMFRLALGHKLVDGESLFVAHWLPDRVGRGEAKFATCFEGIDPDRMSNPYQQIDTRYLRGGVEIDDLGVRVAAHIRKAEPNDYYGALESMIWERVPYEDAEDGFVRIIHDFDADRFGQHRGLSIFAPILGRMKMLARYYGIKLQQENVQSAFGTYVVSPFDNEMVQEALTAPGDGGGALNAYQDLRTAFHAKHQLQINGVRIATLAPGEDIKTVQPSGQAGEFSPFTHEMLRSVAAALGVSAEQVHNDYSEAYYSSIRASIVEAEKTYDRRCQEFSLNTATPFYAAWMHEAMDRGLLPLPKCAPSFMECRTAYARCQWLGPAAGWVDPVKERQGVVLGLDACLTTLEIECARQGLSSEEVLDKRAEELQMMRDRKIPPPLWMGNLETATKVSTPEQEPQAA